eukprot:2299732-Rhodomonas_salina.3
MSVSNIARSVGRQRCSPCRLFRASAPDSARDSAPGTTIRHLSTRHSETRTVPTISAPHIAQRMQRGYADLGSDVALQPGSTARGVRSWRIAHEMRNTKRGCGTLRKRRCATPRSRAAAAPLAPQSTQSAPRHCHHSLRESVDRHSLHSSSVIQLSHAPLCPAPA